MANEAPPPSGFLVLLFPMRYYLLIAAAGLSVHLFLVYWRLRHIPGPFLGRFPKLWLIRSTAKGSTFWDLDALCKKYGNIRCQFASEA